MNQLLRCFILGGHVVQIEDKDLFFTSILLHDFLIADYQELYQVLISIKYYYSKWDISLSQTAYLNGMLTIFKASYIS